MAQLITTTFDDPDPLDCPTTFSQLIVLLRQLVRSTLNGTFIPYVTGAATPSVDDQDKVWHRVDASGRPLGTYLFYSGTWRRQYSGNLGEVVMYSGDPAIDFAGTDGAGTIGGEWDGWQLMNGLNGAADLSDKFVVGAKMSDMSVGYPAGTGPWQTGVSGATTQEGAGVHEIQLDATNTYRPAVPAIEVSKWEATGNTLNPAGDLYGRGTAFDLVAADPGNPTPPAIPTLPPYYALAFVTFQGYP